MYNIASQHKTTNSELSHSYESKIKVFANDYCLGEEIISENVRKDFYFISGTLPELNARGNWQPSLRADRENWIGPDGMTQYARAYKSL